LLVSDGNGISDKAVTDLPDLLRGGDLLIFNDTKVIPARLSGDRIRADTTVAVEANLIERLDASTWRALARPGKRLRVDDTITFSDDLAATVSVKEEGGAIQLCFNREGTDLDAAIASCGVMPLPPYIAGKRPADAQDERDYQTILARNEGAVAAPTAALHYDEPLLERLSAKGVGHTTVTLHVGAGTFLPVKSETTGDHVMHSETGAIDRETADLLNDTKARGGRVICVGTTALRVIETAADETGRVNAWSGATDIFISPGYQFKAVDALLTNFHLPRSTLMMLVAGFIGIERTHHVYRHAIASGYRFYSYGDTSLLLPN
jgi:S-adenosylmethionine:tRNA ribosyltransferase-isomerase